MTAKEMVDDLLKRGKIKLNEHVGLQLQMAHEKNTLNEDKDQQLTEANALIDVLNDFALRVKNALPDNSILGVAAKKHCEKVNEYKTKQTTTQEVK